MSNIIKIENLQHKLINLEQMNSKHLFATDSTLVFKITGTREKSDVLGLNLLQILLVVEDISLVTSEYKRKSYICLILLFVRYCWTFSTISIRQTNHNAEEECLENPRNRMNKSNL